MGIFDSSKAKDKPKKGDEVDFGPIKGAKVVGTSGNKDGRIEIESKNGTRFSVDPSEVTKK